MATENMPPQLLVTPSFSGAPCHQTPYIIQSRALVFHSLPSLFFHLQNTLQALANSSPGPGFSTSINLCNWTEILSSFCIHSPYFYLSILYVSIQRRCPCSPIEILAIFFHLPTFQTELFLREVEATFYINQFSWTPLLSRVSSNMTLSNKYQKWLKSRDVILL